MCSSHMNNLEHLSFEDGFLTNFEDILRVSSSHTKDEPGSFVCPGSEIGLVTGVENLKRGLECFEGCSTNIEPQINPEI